MNLSIGPFEALVRTEFLYDGDPEKAGYLPCMVFGCASLAGRAIGFHVLLGNGAQFGRLPVSALCIRPCEALPLDLVALWDAPSYEMEFVMYEALDGAKVEVVLKDGAWRRGTYLGTFDWWGSEVAEGAGELGWKCAHFIVLDTGQFALQPNNRMRFLLPEWTTEPFPERPDYKTNTRIFRSESSGSKWATEGGYFYGVKSS